MIGLLQYCTLRMNQYISNTNTNTRNTREKNMESLTWSVSRFTRLEILDFLTTVVRGGELEPRSGKMPLLLLA